MMKTFKLQLARWGQGLVRGSIQGGAVAVRAWVGTAIIGAIGFPELAITIKQGAAVFVAGLVWHACRYVADNPLPEICPLNTLKDAKPE